MRLSEFRDLCTFFFCLSDGRAETVRFSSDIESQKLSALILSSLCFVSLVGTVSNVSSVCFLNTVSELR